jgi:hypothetical protein
MKECNCTNEVEAELQPQESIGHGFPETADHNVTQTINDESVWTMSKYVTFVNRNQELYGEIMEEGINTLDTSISVKKDGKENTPCTNKVLRENRDN